MHQNKRIRTSHGDNNAAFAHKNPGGVQYRSSSSINGNISAPSRNASKKMTKQKKHSALRFEGDNTGGQRILRHIKVCVICGNSNEVIDLSANPIMKETMSSYCETDDVDLDDCLSSVCITCVFKSRAVKEVQNKFKLRLKDFSSNGHALKPNQNNAEIDYSYGEIEGRQAMEEKSYRKEEIIELNTDIKHRADNIHVNGSYGINNSLSRMRGIEGSPCLSTASYVHSSNLPIHKAANNIKSVEYVEHKSIIQLDYKNYRITDISSDCPTIQHVESINTEYNDNISTTVLSPQRIDFMPILKNHASSMASSCSNSTLSQNGLSHSMLQVIRERPESVLITESGGKINNYKSSKHPLTQRVCQYCGSSYVRKDHYNKHMRRCRSISARSQLSSNAESKKQFNAKRTRTNGTDKNNITPTPPVEAPQKQRSRQFHCSECLATMDNITQMRQHRITHLREYKCNMCRKVFTTLYEHDFHRIICLAEKQALIEEQEDNEISLNYDNKSVAKSERSIATRRVTRAQSRAQTQVIKNAKTKTTKILSTISKRRMTVLTSVSKFIPANDDRNSDMDGCYSSNNETDDDVSVADSMDSRRRIYTDDWLEKRHTDEIDETPAMQIEIGKEYDLMLLDSLKAQVKAQEFTCLVENCGFFTDTLLNLMLHDYVHHFKASWFYCQKCSSVFTSKVFLDYHLDRQNFGRYICYKCNEQFMFQHQLDSHLILHTKQANYTCTKCRCAFLTQGKLEQHRKIEHSNESERKLIRIQSKETFTSPTYSADEDDFINREECTKYTLKILNMHLPRMPSKRPLDLPGHKPYRRRIGVIEFENERNPNCCSCK